MYHTTTIDHRDPTHKRIIHFGGLDDDHLPGIGGPDTWHPVESTIIVELGNHPYGCLLLCIEKSAAPSDCYCHEIVLKIWANRNRIVY